MAPRKSAVKTAPTTTTLPPLQQAFRDTEDSMNNRVVERSTFVRVLMLALVGKLDVFGLGPPGVAKTMTVTTLRDHIADLSRSDYFWRLLTKFSVPAELFGPPDLKAMDEGIWRFQTKNTMVDARFIILDEIFKANSAILNTLLTFMNEGIFHNDVPIVVPKWTVFGISNEMPQGEELNALFDRLDLRLQIEAIQSSSGFISMLKGDMLGPIVPTLTVAQIEQAQKEVTEITVSDETRDGLLTLRNDLAREGVEPSDRRFARSLAIVKAATWLRGGTSTEIDDMRDLVHSLWSSLDEKQKVTTHVLQLASPLDAEAMKLRDDIDKLSEEFEIIFKDSDNKTVRNKKAIDLHSKLDRGTEDLELLQAQLAPGRRSEIMDEMQRRLGAMTDQILREVFNIDPESKKAAR